MYLCTPKNSLAKRGQRSFPLGQDDNITLVSRTIYRQRANSKKKSGTHWCVLEFLAKRVSAFLGNSANFTCKIDSTYSERSHVVWVTVSTCCQR